MAAAAAAFATCAVSGDGTGPSTCPLLQHVRPRGDALPEHKHIHVLLCCFMVGSVAFLNTCELPVAHQHKGHSAKTLSIDLYLQRNLEAGQGARVACLGVGAGALPLFLHRRLPRLAVDAVELDPAVALAAQRCFGFPPAQARAPLRVCWERPAMPAAAGCRSTATLLP